VLPRVGDAGYNPPARRGRWRRAGPGRPCRRSRAGGGAGEGSRRISSELVTTGL